MMRKLGDVMRFFAWCLVVAGLVIGSIYISYATYETTTREAVWIQRELSSQSAARLRRLLIRDIDEEVRPAGVIVSCPSPKSRFTWLTTGGASATGQGTPGNLR